MKSVIVLLILVVLASGNAGVLVEGMARLDNTRTHQAGRVALQAADVVARSAGEVMVERILPKVPSEWEHAARRAAKALRLLVRLRLLSHDHVG